MSYDDFQSYPSQASNVTDELGELMANDPDLCPGLNACMVCGLPTTMFCPKCRMVSYCSKECLKSDACVPMSSPTPGHCVEICDALRSSSSNVNDEEEGDRSELESYPSTLSNVLLSHPSFEGVVQEGGRRDGKKGERRILQVHIVGAQKGSEVWDEKGGYGGSGWVSAYSDALDEVCETFDVSLELVFVGEGLKEVKEADGRIVKLSKTCHAYLHSGKYEALKNKVTPNNFVRRTPDLLVFFNAGFTCLDYDWSGCLSTCFSPRSPTVPFLATTNSEMENFNDIEWLEENGFVKEGSIAGLGADVDDTDVDEVPLFAGPNPFQGSKIRQSGILGNDLYTKSSFMFGGCMTFGRRK
eukprot:CAMPEP_0118666358 /NCGR_PEP_ID=MMETSP0785-20121206/19168_1 /TAXON_ID=91992 /ORGANISM="Bolidomonas pacifica, Strain CCMP 1866" /LENGTH=355 /DNA_ID=CAMNT_0006560655 /DNA_START=96 /DNA_END=1160 /DNA_ORIENTATION=-